MEQGTHEQGRKRLTGVTSTALISVNSGDRLHITNLVGSVDSPSTSSIFNICDGATGTILYSMDGATYSSFNFDFGPVGYYLASVSDNLLVEQSGGSATASIFGIGYARG